MLLLKFCYPEGNGVDYIDYQTGEVLSYKVACKLGYKFYSYSECELYSSRYHHSDCTCKYCLNGREYLSPNEY